VPAPGVCARKARTTPALRTRARCAPSAHPGGVSRRHPHSWSPAMAAPLSHTPVSPLRTVAVVGLGTMGTGITEVLAAAGREVVGIDISEVQAAKCVAALEASTARAVQRGRLTEQERIDRKSTLLNSSHVKNSYAVYCL